MYAASVQVSGERLRLHKKQPSAEPQRQRASLTHDLTRETPECFADQREAENIPFAGHKELDLTERRRVPIIMCTSILRRSKQSGTLVKACAGYPDGAKIYICYRRC